jgi:hypothetical protein
LPGSTTAGIAIAGGLLALIVVCVAITIAMAIVNPGG